MNDTVKIDTFQCVNTRKRWSLNPGSPGHDRAAKGTQTGEFIRIASNYEEPTLPVKATGEFARSVSPGSDLTPGAFGGR